MHDYAAEQLADSLLRKHEGERLRLYRCTSNKLTVGVGRNIEDVGIYPDEMELMLANDITRCANDLSNFHWYANLSARRKAALIDLRFCLGPAGFRGFRKMISALEAKDYAEAGRQIADSTFAKQTGSRAVDLQKLMEEG